MPRMTPLEFDAFQARRQVAQEVEAPRIKIYRESYLQRMITQNIRHRGWLACHSAMHAPTKRTPGEPDYHVLAPKGRHFMVECKTATGRISEDQQWFSARANELGHSVWIVRSIEEWFQVAKSFEKEAV